MFNNFFCEMNGKKGIHWEEGAWWNRGTVQIASWKCNFSIYLDIHVYYLVFQAITTLLCLLLVLYVQGSSIYLIFYLTTTLLKSAFSGTQKPTTPTVFNLQASDWVHCEEETDQYLGLPINWLFYFLFFKSCLFCPQKISAFQKIP